MPKHLQYPNEVTNERCNSNNTTHKMIKPKEKEASLNINQINIAVIILEIRVRRFRSIVSLIILRI